MYVSTMNCAVMAKLIRACRHLLDDQAFDLNVYLDTILECIFDYAGDRRILFSCFHPEICVALRAKQARYPVLYLTEGGMNAPTYTDVRCRSLDAASEFVIRERLQVSGVIHILLPAQSLTSAAITGRGDRQSQAA